MELKYVVRWLRGRAAQQLKHLQDDQSLANQNPRNARWGWQPTNNFSFGRRRQGIPGARQLVRHFYWPVLDLIDSLSQRIRKKSDRGQVLISISLGRVYTCSYTHVNTQKRTGLKRLYLSLLHCLFVRFDAGFTMASNSWYFCPQLGL